MSIARHYGGVNYMGHAYVIASDEQGQPLVRTDVLKAEQEALRAASSSPGSAAGRAPGTQGQLL